MSEKKFAGQHRLSDLNCQSVKPWMFTTRYPHNLTVGCDHGDKTEMMEQVDSYFADGTHFRMLECPTCHRRITLCQERLR